MREERLKRRKKNQHNKKEKKKHEKKKEQNITNWDKGSSYLHLSLLLEKGEIFVHVSAFCSWQGPISINITSVYIL